jgi:NADPH-dependent 2,4-dienoyl-CoA reductase/sulfur reductase-like enzyme
MTESYALLVIGGGPAGLAAARGYRDAGGEGDVAIVGDEHRMPYQRPPLTKELLRGESTEAELPIEDEAWFDRVRIRLISGRAVALDAGERSVILSGGRELDYEQCVLATGGEPARLPVPGADHPRVRVVRTLDHLRELTTRLDDGTDVVVIGSGFIGCEIASSLRIRGQRVSLVSDESAPNQARLGGEVGELIAGWLAEDGVELELGAPVERIEASNGSVRVVTDSRALSGELVVMAAGITPRIELALQAGLEADGGAIPVSASMRTERDGLLAAGDVCKAVNAAAGRALRVEHWGDALTQGQVAGKIAAGAEAEWDEVPGFWSTIGRRTLKFVAWGDGYDDSELHGDRSGFVARYGRDGKLVGVLANEADDQYERGREQIERGDEWHS